MILAMSNVKGKKAPEDKRYVAFYLMLCIERLLTYNICLGIRFLPKVIGADIKFTNRVSKDLDDPMNWPLGRRGEFLFTAMIAQNSDD